MTSSRDPVILVLLIIVILVAAGWLVASINSGKPTPSTLPVTPNRSIPTTPIPSSGYWIKIDPISDKQVGEIFTVNSTTNLSAGAEIYVEVYTAHWHTHTKSYMGEFSGGVGTIKVIPGRNDTNTISFTVNSSSFNLVPDEYRIIEQGIYKDSTGDVQSNAMGEARFNITPIKTS